MFGHVPLAVLTFSFFFTHVALAQETGRIRGNQPAIVAADRIDAAVTAVIGTFSGQSMDRLPVGTKEVGQMIVDAVSSTK